MRAAPLVSRRMPFAHGEQAVLADPVRQHEGRPAGVHHHADVRAGVADTEEHATREQVAQRFQVLVLADVVEERPTVGFVGDPQEGFRPVLARGLGHGREVVVAA